MARDHEEPDSLPNHVPMSEDDGQFSELAIFLAQTWQSSSTDRIDLDTISRIWAFDLGWFNMDTANRVRDNLIKTEWLDVTSEGVKPNVMIENVDVPFGWLPTMRILETPPQAPRQTQLPSNEAAVEVVVDEGWRACCAGEGVEPRQRRCQTGRGWRGCLAAPSDAPRRRACEGRREMGGKLLGKGTPIASLCSVVLQVVAIIEILALSAPSTITK